MDAPNHEASKAAGLCFERGQISDTALVRSAAVVDYENIARMTVLHCL